MSNGGKPLILIADDSEVSREYLANILIASGYDVIRAVDGGSALKVVAEHDVALALIDHHMQPLGGLDFAKSIHSRRLTLPMVMITSEVTSDLLLQITKYNISTYLQKPVDPARLTEVVRRSLRHLGAKTDAQPTGTTIYKSKFSADELMDKVIEMAGNNVESGRGGPFAAIVTDQDGVILGEGVNGLASRSDPVAHAEVMAIRQATEKLNKTSLEGCRLYSSSEPTRIGRALAESVGIEKVFFALSHADINDFYQPKTYKAVDYLQLTRDKALAMINAVTRKK